MPDPKGPWNVNGNGYAGLLWIEGVDAQGNLLPNSTIYGDKIYGFWDDAAQRLTFVRVINPADPTAQQIYLGYLMESQADRSLAFAGFFHAFSGTGAVARRVEYGWYGTR